jgi:hypothetical protein
LDQWICSGEKYCGKINKISRSERKGIISCPLRLYIAAIAARNKKLNSESNSTRVRRNGCQIKDLKFGS